MRSSAVLSIEIIADYFNVCVIKLGLSCCVLVYLLTVCQLIKDSYLDQYRGGSSVCWMCGVSLLQAY